MMEFSAMNVKRGSVLSQERFSGKIRNTQLKDRYFFNHFLFFFYGLSNLSAFSFFLNANDFWMYKFRDVSQLTYNSTNKTDLQIYFASATTVSQSVPSIVVALLVAFYGHKIEIRRRNLGIIFISLLMFVTTTATVLIDTDSWQTEFFFFILIVYLVIIVGALYFQVCLMTLVSKFPPIYSKTQMYGSGAAGIFGAVLQIVSLAVSKGSTRTAAMIYFTFGTLIFLITFVLSYVSKYSMYHEFYIGDAQGDTEKKSYRISEIWDTTKKTWSCHIIFSISWLLTSVGYPNISCLIVSEYYNSGSIWNRIYFVPVVTFLCSEISAQSIRVIAGPVLTKNNQWFIAILFLLRAIVLGPIFFFCRTSPKVHSPLWFPHDWQYVIIVIINSSVNSYFLAISFLSIPRLAGEQMELAFILLQTYGILVSSSISPFVFWLSEINLKYFLAYKRVFEYSNFGISDQIIQQCGSFN